MLRIYMLRKPIAQPVVAAYPAVLREGKLITTAAKQLASLTLYIYLVLICL